MEITKATHEDLTTYALIIDGEEVATLDIETDTRIVAHVETLMEHRGNGYARALWDHANTEAECFHALEHHRTAEGQCFAEAVGGETIDDETGYVAQCCICTGEDVA